MKRIPTGYIFILGCCVFVGILLGGIIVAESLCYKITEPSNNNTSIVENNTIQEFVYCQYIDNLDVWWCK